MKFDCGETFAEKRARLGQWHRFYAIFPRRIGPHDCRMFEILERRGTHSSDESGSWWYWEYRAIA